MILSKGNIALALADATPVQLLRVETLIRDHACRYDGIHNYDRIIGLAIQRLSERCFNNPDLLRVLGDLVSSDKLVEALSK